MKISLVVLYNWEIYLMPLAELDSVKKMVPYTTDQKIFFIETLSSSGGFLLPWRDTIFVAENFSSCCTIDNHYLQDSQTA
jgi:hypothetical protein